MYVLRGGVHTDGSFTEIVPGTEMLFGPFTQDQLHDKWESLTQEHRDDNPMFRLFASPI